MNDCCFFKQADDIRRKRLMRKLALPYRFTAQGIEPAYPQHKNLLACTAKCATLIPEAKKEQTNARQARVYDHGRPRSDDQGH